MKAEVGGSNPLGHPVLKHQLKKRKVPMSQEAYESDRDQIINALTQKDSKGNTAPDSGLIGSVLREVDPKNKLGLFEEYNSLTIIGMAIGPLAPQDRRSVSLAVLRAIAEEKEKGNDVTKDPNALNNFVKTYINSFRT